MDKRTLLAVVLSTIVISIGLYLPTILNPPKDVPADQQTVTDVPADTTSGNTADSSTSDSSTAAPADNAGATQAAPSGSSANADTGKYDFGDRGFAVVGDSAAASTETVPDYVDPGFIRVQFDARGGNITQVDLMQHIDNGEPLKFIFGKSDKQGLTLSLGGVDGELLDPVFNFRYGASKNIYEFYQTIVLKGHEDQPFEIIKRYTFEPKEYMFQLDVEFRNSVNDFVPLNYNGDAYTIGIGPQIGPQFTELPKNGRVDYRKFSYIEDGKRKDEKAIPEGERRALDQTTSWAAINGKYFVAVAMPGNSGSEFVFDTQPTAGGIQGDQLYMIRPQLQSSRVNDSYKFYFGPKSTDDLKIYNNSADNAFGVRDLNLDVLVESMKVLGFLVVGLKAILTFFYNFIHNWGVAIILLTILVKIVLWPITRKSYESNAKMKEIGPKTAALKEKYPDDPQKLNAATMELYKAEGVNPLGGCLPMLLQFPFFIAMYSLFNNQFDLRGAVFIPGWITDLSAPEAIYTFKQGLTFLSFHLDAIRLLPLIFLGTQLLSTKLTQPADQSQSSGQMKMMTLGLPIMFFFIMYNMPSGLLVYWIMQNVITTGQQLTYNYFTHKKNTQAASEVATKAKKKR